MTDYRGLGFDPTPGDPEAVAAASRRCALAVELPGVPEGWSGAAAEGLATRWEAVVSELAAVRRAMRAAAEVLDAWAGELLDNRRRAEELDARAVRLRRDLADAADEVDRTGALASFTPAHGDEHAAAVARHDDVARRLEDVLTEARLLERDHHAQARRVAERLRSAEETRGRLADALTGWSAATEELASVLFGGRSALRPSATGFAGAWPPAPGSIVPPGTDDSGRGAGGSGASWGAGGSGASGEAGASRGAAAFLAGLG